tara:strand:- start:2937 stop:3188 length:252 start_codon:yes stop_codon:yes gene_type:complete
MTNIQWAIDLYGRRLKRDDTNDMPGRNVHTREARRLKLCPNCQRVWEIGCTGACMRYEHLPTFRLKRVTCTLCEGNGKPYKER